MKNHAGSGAIYGIGIIGALVYFIQTSTSFLDGVWGIILAFFWPAVIVYEALEAFKV